MYRRRSGILGRGEPSDTYTWTSSSGGWYHANEAYRELPGLPYTLKLCQTAGYPLIPTITYGADGEDRVNQVLDGGQNPVTSTTYNTASLPTQVNYGAGNSDSRAYDPNTYRPTQY